MWARAAQGWDGVWAMEAVMDWNCALGGPTLAQVGHKKKKLMEGEELVSSGIFHSPFPPSLKQDEKW